MALTNLILTVVGVGAAMMLLRKDVKQSSAVFRRNIRHIRNWLEEESAATYTLQSLPSLYYSIIISPNCSGTKGMGIIGLDLSTRLLSFLS